MSNFFSIGSQNKKDAKTLTTWHEHNFGHIKIQIEVLEDKTYPLAETIKQLEFTICNYMILNYTYGCDFNSIATIITFH